jgi:DNA-binding transcriptional ArsR family regulator
MTGAQLAAPRNRQQVVGSDMSTVSKHLSVMRNAGLVQDRKVGLQVFYRLRVPCVMLFFGCVEAVMASRFAPVTVTEQQPAKSRLR